jgi:hypothetical protein
MTPLAQRIVNQVTIPISKRTFRDPCNLTGRMSDVHCFEVTQVIEMVHEMVAAAGSLDSILRNMGALAFLPAPRTWLEWRDSEVGREGVLLETNPDGSLARCTWACGGDRFFQSQDAEHNFCIGLKAEIPLMLQLKKYHCARRLRGESLESMSLYTASLYALLAVINSPRTISQKRHKPHRGLQKSLIKGLGAKFTLHEWNEIVLDVSLPTEVVPPIEGEAVLTGRRALHFVRSHIRLRDGKLSYVKAHWRGDASVGIKQARYRVAGPDGLQ